MKSFPRNLISLRPRRNPSRNHWRKKLRLTSFLWLVSEVTTVLKSQGDLSHLCYCICPVWIYVRNIIVPFTGWHRDLNGVIRYAAQIWCGVISTIPERLHSSKRSSSPGSFLV
jgi:hypothetical protein